MQAFGQRSLNRIQLASLLDSRMIPYLTLPYLTQNSKLQVYEEDSETGRYQDSIESFST